MSRTCKHCPETDTNATSAFCFNNKEDGVKHDFSQAADQDSEIKAELSALSASVRELVQAKQRPAPTPHDNLQSFTALQQQAQTLVEQKGRVYQVLVIFEDCHRGTRAMISALADLTSVGFEGQYVATTKLELRVVGWRESIVSFMKAVKEHFSVESKNRIRYDGPWLRHWKSTPDLVKESRRESFNDGQQHSEDSDYTRLSSVVSSSDAPSAFQPESLSDEQFRSMGSIARSFMATAEKYKQQSDEKSELKAEDDQQETDNEQSGPSRSVRQAALALLKKRMASKKSSLRL
jgi:hypothetical protein